MNKHTAFQIVASALVALTLMAMQAQNADALPPGCRRIPHGTSCPSTSGSSYRTIRCDPGYTFKVVRGTTTGWLVGTCR
jgi:hypothetical protein